MNPEGEFPDFTRSQILDKVTSIINVAETHVQNIKDNESEEEIETEKREKPSNEVMQTTQPSISETENAALQESDRPILLKHFRQLDSKSSSVRKINKFLSMALNEYFSRNNVERAFYELRPEQIRLNSEIYKRQIENIHKLKQEKSNLMAEIEEENAKKLREKDEAVKQKAELIKDFFDTIDSTAKLLDTSGQRLTEKKIMRLFNRFQLVHKQLSKVRFDYMMAQSSLEDLVEKDRKLDDLGDGFKAFDYENLRTELQTITSRIDTKNEELERMRMRYGRNIQLFEKHEKCRLQVEKKLEEQTRILKDEMSVKENLMKKQFQLKKTKDTLQNKLGDLHQKAQLLTNTSLMLQYDKMEEQLKARQEELRKYDEQNEKLDENIQKYKALEGQLLQNPHRLPDV